MKTSQFYTGLKWHQLRHWRAIGCRAPACVSMNNAPIRVPVVDFPVLVDGGSFGNFNKKTFKPGELEALLDDSEDVRREREERHARRAKRLLLALGRMWVVAVGPLDLMCEDFMLRKTGLTIEEHQRRTVGNYVRLCAIDPTIPWLPVIQGYTLADYLRCVEMYRSAGVDLTEVERVGIGTLCRRQGTKEAVAIVVAIIRLGIRVHLFGFKLDGLRLLRTRLTSQEWDNLTADSAAWSKHAWKSQILMPGHYHGAITKNCANCPIYANVRRLEIEAALAA